MPATGGAHLRLIDERMPLDLVDDQRFGREFHRVVDQGDGEVRHADVLRQPCSLHLTQRADGIRERNARVGPVDKEEIDLRQAQARQAFRGRALQLASSEMIRPDFGGDEDVAARNAGGTQPLPHLTFVFVDLGRVDMAVADAQRLFDHARAGASAQFPVAEPDRRNGRAVCVDELHDNPSAAIEGRWRSGEKEDFPHAPAMVVLASAMRGRQSPPSPPIRVGQRLTAVRGSAVPNRSWRGRP